ncbi:Succinate dehydrogenase cytochrome B subunit, mitochondrial [Cytospora mali]|uniref:Succinate dehydrogenase cytochrome B subunit, mitochondrial n=1 Tax=Cytospora mali TaxID=578113 RepID=A0A194ULN8_CYTMA|nr:Succinate dehydrogenase cytochrome B subunit, mitochondrial [Valsa mali var. pyri (nom. inval.)]
MNTSRAGLTALRRAAKPSVFFTSNAVRATSLSTSQHRSAATQPLTHAESDALLASQRRARPVSPHLQIYDKSQTFLGSSIWQRFTGMFFTGGLYAYSVGYLVAPLAGWHLESASVAAAFATLPVLVKGGVKITLAWPFVYHAINGIKHLVNDTTAKGFRKTTIKKNEYLIWGSSTVIAVAVAFLL